MNTSQIIEILRFTSPIFAQLICIFLLLRSYNWGDEPSRKKLTFLLVFVKACSIMSWFCILLYIYKPEIFIRIHCLYYLVLLNNSVLFFHFVHILTQTDTHRQFSYIHYIIPFVIVIPLAIWSLFIPSEVKLYIVCNNGAVKEGYELYSIFFTSKMAVNAIYYIFYMVWKFIRLHYYRKAIKDYSANIAGSSMLWLYIFMFASILAIPLTVGAAIIPRATILDSVFIIISIILVMLQGTIITYNTIVGKYVIIYKDKDNSAANKDIRNKILVQQMEKYMQTDKPYLNPNLKITDLSSALGTNRSRLSQLINQHYNMNFCCWVNNYRLQEYNNLDNENVLSKRELAEDVGFSDYRTYIRFKQKILEIEKMT